MSGSFCLWTPPCDYLLNIEIKMYLDKTVTDA